MARPSHTYIHGFKSARIQENYAANNAKSNGSGRDGSFGTAEFLAYRADTNDSRAWALEGGASPCLRHLPFKRFAFFGA